MGLESENGSRLSSGALSQVFAHALEVGDETRCPGDVADGADTAETISGNPTERTPAAADNEFAQLGSRGAGQPYLLAVVLRDEPNTWHLRAYLIHNPGDGVYSVLGRNPDPAEDRP